MTGSSGIPSILAASRRPWPAIRRPVSSTSTGIVHPNSCIEAAIFWMTAGEWVFGLFS
jgi:hypothetical protein